MRGTAQRHAMNWLEVINKAAENLGYIHVLGVAFYLYVEGRGSGSKWLQLKLGLEFEWQAVMKESYLFGREESSYD